MRMLLRCVMTLAAFVSLRSRAQAYDGEPDAGGVDRPNVVFVLTDDQRWDALGYAGNDIIQTPETCTEIGILGNYAFAPSGLGGVRIIELW